MIVAINREARTELKMMPNRNRGALLVLLLCIQSSPAGAQAPKDRLATATSLNCVFKIVALANWVNGETKGEVKAAGLTVGFSDVNTEESSARAIGRFGLADIIVKLSVGSLHFVQSFREGPVYITSVFASESTPGKLKAVHTRHEYTDVSLPGFTSRPETYYGECEVK